MQGNETGTRDRRVGRRTPAGCPPALTIDLTHTEDLGPQVEWPPAPPTRHAHEAPRDRSPNVTDLTTGRAVHMLDATIAHLRTALEASDDEAESDCLERAITDIARARETLGPLVR